MKLTVTSLLLFWAHTLRGQPAYASYYGDSLVAVPPAVARAYQHYCARLVADSTTHWQAELDSFEPGPVFKFVVTGQYLHHDSRLAAPFSVGVEAEFNARGEAIRYAYEVSPDSLPWLTRRGVRRVARRHRRRWGQELCLLVATVQPAPVRRERLTYTAYFRYTDGAGEQYVGEQSLQRNGRSVYQGPKFRHW